VKEAFGKLDSSSLRIAIVVSRFNEIVTGKLLHGALDVLKRTGCRDEAIDVIHVPGSFEIPLAIRVLAQKGEYQALICLGAIIKGETDHDRYLGSRVTDAVGQIGLEFGIPIGYGLVTVDTAEQAMDRAGLKQGNKGADAALAAIEMASLLKSL